MSKYSCLVLLYVFNIACSMAIEELLVEKVRQTSIIFDPVGVDIHHPVVSGCLNKDDFTQDPTDPTKFYRCVDGVQNSMHCAPGTVFEGLLFEDQLVVVKNQCGYAMNQNWFVEKPAKQQQMQNYY